MERQEILDRFYFQNGPCCAGCDWWHSLSSLVGYCTRSAPAPDQERWAMIGIEGSSLPPGAGHIATLREHKCGDFKDEFDWTTLPLAYRRRIGAPTSVKAGDAS